MQNQSTPLSLKEWELPVEITARLGDHAGRQRVLDAKSHLLLVMHAPPEPSERLRRARFFWRDPEGNWSCQKVGDELLTLEDHLSDYEDILDELDNIEARTEAANDYYRVLEKLTPVLRSVRHMHQVLQQARTTFPDAHELINVRDWAYRLERIGELLYETCKNGFDIAVARNAELQALESKAMARSAHRLNLFVAFFFPVATVSGIISIRQGFGSSASPINGILLVAGCLTMGLVLTYFIGTRRRING